MLTCYLKWYSPHQRCLWILIFLILKSDLGAMDHLDLILSWKAMGPDKMIGTQPIPHLRVQHPQERVRLALLCLSAPPGDAAASEPLLMGCPCGNSLGVTNEVTHWKWL